MDGTSELSEPSPEVTGVVSIDLSWVDLAPTVYPSLPLAAAHSADGSAGDVLC